MRVPLHGLSKAELMGELSVFQRLPDFQLSLPWSADELASDRVRRIVSGMTFQIFATFGGGTTLPDSTRTYLGLE